MTRSVIDCDTLLQIAAGNIEVAAEHQLVAPTLVRSQVLAALYEAARRGEITAAEGIERVTRMNSLKVRFLGDRVSQRTAWKIAEQLGWELRRGRDGNGRRTAHDLSVLTSESGRARRRASLPSALQTSPRG